MLCTSSTAAPARPCLERPVQAVDPSGYARSHGDHIIMQSSKTILVPIDFQDASLDALTKARELAKTLGFEVVLMHAYTIPIVVYPGFDPIMAPGLPEEIAVGATKALDKLAAEHGGLRTMLRAGDPATEILKAVEETKPTLVAMGTHGRKGFSHLLLGSVAEKVVRSSPAPVLTVHARAR
jgi:nucleotide-binding universal stress UspA family protein